VVDSHAERFSLDLAGVTTTELTTAWSRAIKAGTRVYVSCTAPIWPALPGANRTDRFNDPDPEKQALRCLEIIGSALGQAGAGFQDVVSSHLWLQNAADAPAVARAHASVFGSLRPASSMVVLQGYLRPQWHIEIETEADVGTDRQNVSIAADRPSAARLEASQAVRAGNRVSVSVAGPCRDGEVLAADMSGQLQRCWTTILGALATAGAEAEHVVRARFYIRHPADGDEVARFTHLVFGAVPPAVSVLIVKGFMCPVARVEMEVEAIIE
jgi:enamine deaminase RidA (YjgF/YER057c/UK114 family)